MKLGFKKHIYTHTHIYLCNKKKQFGQMSCTNSVISLWQKLELNIKNF